MITWSFPLKNGGSPGEKVRSGTGVGRRAERALLALILLGAAAAGCKKGSSSNDGGDGGKLEVGGGDVHFDTGDTGSDVPVCTSLDAPKALGDSCACDKQCGSGHCVDGVCCNDVCANGCKTCSSPSAPGMCVNRAVGDPARGTYCPTTPVSTCGTDGMCDGSGGCQKYPINTTCKAGMCDGDAVVGSYSCDGSGHCKPGATRICVPFSCDPSTNDCVDTCATSSQCVSGQQCVGGSCGKRMKGASCKANADCASNFCADGLCCNVACQGPCVSCNLMGREGTCWPIDTDVADPRKICHDTGAATCGQNGLCDGFGGCSKYPRDTVCLAPTCSGNKLNTAGTCDGLGTCSPPGIQNCNPFRCANGACTVTCTTNADCDTGIACVNGTCGPKQDGQSCEQSSECQHNHCVDKVCCDQACAGACRSCALAATMGRCTPIAAGTADPRNMCTAMPQSSCGTNGKCDGNGGCAPWPVGTLCADETCNPAGNLYKAPSQCNSAGQCVPPDLLACSPYICNGTRCFNACTNDSQCVPPNICVNNSCGLKELGASCSAGTECKSTFCAQGVCCDKACNTACKSCIAGTAGNCTDVTGSATDPTGMCPVTDPSTCGTNGKCQAGACQKWIPGTGCMPATCPSTNNLFTAQSTCDGAGTCVVPGTMACFPYRCDTTACKASCMSDADCLAPARCTNGSCGLSPIGGICASKDQCQSGYCEQGICCQTACTGICKSCALSASRGTCSNVALGSPDIMSRCSDQGAPSCGTDGFCDGKGACRLYGAGTMCASASCPTNQSTQVNARSCDGMGVCQTATTKACAPYVCNGSTACLGTCSGDQDCLPPNICDPKTSHCGNQHRLGQPCTGSADCLTGNFCVDGVCCSSSSCGLCQSCNVGTAAGNCANVPAGTAAPAGQCTASPPCGNTGMCNGAGACQLAATTVSCGTQSCSGSTFTPLSHCNGTGGCLAPTASSCTPYVCATDTCRNTCAMDSHCLSPFTCQGSPPNRSCALKPNGTSCTAANQCISGNCIDTVCCGSATCGTCQTCNGTMPGTCTPLAAGTLAPTGQCTASPPCGNTGTCNGASGCTQAATTVSCGAAVSCTGTTYQPQSFCTGGGACNQQATSSCGNYVCGSNACRTNCNSDAHCASTSLYCTGNATTAGSCVAKKANGATCGGPNECASGNCIDGVCCSTGSCSVCQSCALSGNGTCANVGSGTAEPHGGCATTSNICGNTGFCNGAGACEQKSASTTCGSPVSCNGTTFQPASHCSGSGTCVQAGTSDCGAYQCGVNACKTSCAGDGDCTGSYWCSGGSCVAKKANGAACGGGNQCVNGNCVDGSCCATAGCPTCQSCGLNGLGTCSNVGSGTTDPHGRCSDSGVCRNTGACDGNGACQMQPSNLQCGAGVSCTGSTYQPASFCSGSGTCSQASTVSCSPFACNAAGSACLTSCNNTDDDCISKDSYFCTGANGSCQPKKTPGSSCGSGHECTTGSCVDGVCCNSSSCATCWVCNGSSPGSCTPVADGQMEPHNQCGSSPPCGNTGFCSGGVCAKTGAGIMCTSFNCLSATTFQPAGACNGTGNCIVPSTFDCTPYQCTTGSCRTSCDVSNELTQCAQPGAYCNGASCALKKDNGAGCGRDGECSSGHCTEGVCCNVGACPQCQSCKVPLNEGACTNVAPHTVDPQGSCANQGAASCGTNGRCNGSGVCELYDMSTVCNTVCLSPTFTTFYCDGLGTCALPQIETCASLTCDANGCTL
jgi:hypothetical protein